MTDSGKSTLAFDLLLAPESCRAPAGQEFVLVALPFRFGVPNESIRPLRLIRAHPEVERCAGEANGCTNYWLDVFAVLLFRQGRPSPSVSSGPGPWGSLGYGVVPSRSFAITGKWSLGNWPSREKVTISMRSAVHGPRLRIQSMRAPSF